MSLKTYLNELIEATQKLTGINEKINAYEIPTILKNLAESNGDGKLYKHNIKCEFNNGNNFLYIPIYSSNSTPITTYNQIINYLGYDFQHAVSMYDANQDIIYIGDLSYSGELWYYANTVYGTDTYTPYEIGFTDDENFSNITDDVIFL